MLVDHHSCKSLMHIVDFDNIVKLQHEDKYDELDKIMSQAAWYLE